MQRLLTQEEYDDLVPKAELEQSERALKWCFEKLRPENCPERKENWHKEGYCDDCAIANLTSGGDDDYYLSKLICTNKLRRFSK